MKSIQNFLERLAKGDLVSQEKTTQKNAEAELLAETKKKFEYLAGRSLLPRSFYDGIGTVKYTVEQIAADPALKTLLDEQFKTVSG
jgi:hypothetical protein